MMNTFTYWPYDEVSIESQSNDVVLKTPWLIAQTSTEHFNLPKLRELQKKLEEKSLSIADIELVNDFFQNFDQYPVAYILPAPKSSSLLDKHQLADVIFLNATFEEILRAIFISNFDGIQEDCERDFQKLLAVLPRTHWEWDTESALDFASVQNEIHPESIFSVCRRYHILEIMSNDNGSELFQELSESDIHQTKLALCKLVRQNHYVTEQCQKALAPALAIAGKASSLIEDFMRQEKGHDKILRKALQSMGEEPENIAVSVQTKTLMSALQFFAKRNFLAFAMAIDAFERNNFEDVDPMANLLAKKGYDKAADYIDRHKKINDQGEHDNIAVTFLSCMDTCDRAYANEALRMMEILSLLMCSITR